MKQLGVCSMMVVCLCLAPCAEAATATWDPNPEPDVLGYVLAYGTRSGVYTTEINVGKRLSYEFFSPPGYRYYVVVRAYSVRGAGPNSKEVVLDLTTTASNPSPTTESSIVVVEEPSTVGVAGDFDGDGRMDPGVYYRDTGKWQLFYSSLPYGTSVSIVWGAGALPVPADYDGDRRADLAIYRPSTGMWYVLLSSTKMQSQLQLRWGDSTGQPMAFDYDGDGRADLVIVRSGGRGLQILFSSSQWKTAALLK